MTTAQPIGTLAGIEPEKGLPDPQTISGETRKRKTKRGKRPPPRDNPLLEFVRANIGKTTGKSIKDSAILLREMGVEEGFDQMLQSYQIYVSRLRRDSQLTQPPPAKNRLEAKTTTGLEFELETLMGIADAFKDSAKGLKKAIKTLGAENQVLKAVNSELQSKLDAAQKEKTALSDILTEALKRLRQ